MPVLRNSSRLDPSLRFYVYALIDPRNKEPFYIGKGTGLRHDAHVKEYRRGYGWNGDKLRKIGEIIDQGLEPEIKILADKLSESEALRIELETIRSIGWGNLTNILPGSRSKTERAIDWAKSMLGMIKPFEEWMAERPRSEADVQLYRRVALEIEGIASGSVSVEIFAPGISVMVA